MAWQQAVTYTRQWSQDDTWQHDFLPHIRVTIVYSCDFLPRNLSAYTVSSLPTTPNPRVRISQPPAFSFGYFHSFFYSLCRDSIQTILTCSWRCVVDLPRVHVYLWLIQISQICLVYARWHDSYARKMTHACQLIWKFRLRRSNRRKAKCRAPSRWVLGPPCWLRWKNETGDLCSEAHMWTSGHASCKRCNADSLLRPSVLVVTGHGCQGEQGVF